MSWKVTISEMGTNMEQPRESAHVKALGCTNTRVICSSACIDLERARNEDGTCRAANVIYGELQESRIVARPNASLPAPKNRGRGWTV